MSKPLSPKRSAFESGAALAPTRAASGPPWPLMASQHCLQGCIDAYRQSPRQRENKIVSIAFWSWFAKQPDTLLTAQAQRQMEILEKRHPEIADALFMLGLDVEVALIHASVWRDVGIHDQSDIARAQKTLQEAAQILEQHFGEYAPPAWLGAFAPKSGSAAPKILPPGL